MEGLARSRFETVFRDGARVHGPHLALRALPGEGRVGVAVSRAAGCHARRNRLRRRVRAAAAGCADLWPGLDAVVQIGPRAEGVPFAVLAAELADLVHQARERRQTAPWDAASESR